MRTTAPPRIAWATTSGSSGKTTSAIATTAVLAERGLRVLVVDADWQMDGSRWLGIDEDELGDRATLLDVLLDRSRIAEAITASTTIPGVDVLPATPELQDATRILAGQIGAENQLRRALDTVHDNYDAILLDCRAGTEIVTLAALIAATHVVGCTRAGLKELRNTVSLQDHVEAIADGHDRPLTLAGILPCDVPAAGSAYREALDLAADTFGDVLLPPIRHAVAVTEAHAARQPITARARWRGVADDYRAAVDQLAERTGLAALAGAAR